MGDVIRWEIPKAVTDLVKSEAIVWNNLPPEPVKHNIVKSVVEPIDFKSLESLNQIQPNFIRAIDETNYYWMSQTEVTDFLYRASAYGVGVIERATRYGLNLIAGL